MAAARRLRRLLVGLATTAVLAVSFGTIAGASPAALPYYELGQVQCLDGGQLKAYPPRVMRPVYNVDFRNPELVKWSPDLQVRTRRGWRNYDTSRPFYQAVTSIYGYWQGPITGGWTGAQGQVLWVPFFNLPAGTYRVRHWLYWQKLGRTYPVVNRRTCRFY